MGGNYYLTLIHLKARKDLLPENIYRQIKSADYQILQRGWKSVIAGTKEALEFETAFKYILNYLKKLS